MSDERVRVLQVVQHVSLGGATLMAMLLAERLDPERFDVALVAGAEAGPEGSLLEEMHQRGIEVELVPHLGRALRPTRDARATWELGRVLARRRPDIVHTHGSKPKLLVPLAARMAPPMIHVAHIWGWEWQPTGTGVARAACVTKAQLMSDCYDVLISCSQAMREQGLALGVGSPEQYEVAYPSVDPERFAPVDGEADGRTREEAAAALGLPRHATVVGSVMRLAPQKAPDALLRAVALASVAVPRLHLLIVGDGPLRQEVERLVRRLRLDDRVVLVGPRRDVPRLLAACDLFALSSAWEPFGIVYLEAAAMGLPVVGTAVDGAVEAVADGRTGVLVPPGDPVALARAIVRLATDPEGARRMGRAGRRHALQFGHERFVGGVAGVYERLLAERDAAPQR